MWCVMYFVEVVIEYNTILFACQEQSFAYLYFYGGTLCTSWKIYENKKEPIWVLFYAALL